jgi:adenylosuccinate lyase
MIPRYSRPEMQNIWSDQNRYQIWLEVETLALEAMTQIGLAPKDAHQAVKEKGKFDIEQIQKIEAEVKHDVIAFLTNLAEYVGPLSRYVHRGMTSNDLLDTTFGLQLKQSGELILQGLTKVLNIVKKRAEEFKYQPCIGRSHGIHAEPTSFGLKLIGWYAELKRQEKRLKQAIAEVSVGKLAGAVGTYASLPPSIEKHVLSKLGLTAEAVPTQIVQRDRHANFFNALAQLGGTIERCCVEIRHLQRTEVREAEENFTKGQKGSSAMPHKRNPILSENLSGLARLLRGYALTALENVPLWHERDISHSSAERVIAPDACIVMDFMLERFAGLVSGLVVHTNRMQENLDYSRGLIFSGTLLIALVDNGVTREDAYRLVQKHSLEAWDGGADLKTRVLTDAEITSKVSSEILEEVFDLKRHMQHVDFIFERALNN